MSKFLTMKNLIENWRTIFKKTERKPFALTQMQKQLIADYCGSCYLIVSKPLVILSGHDANEINKSALKQLKLFPYLPNPNRFVLPFTIQPGVWTCNVNKRQFGYECGIDMITIVLLPGGSVLGPPEITGWKPRDGTALKQFFNSKNE